MTSAIYDATALHGLLPHRYPFLLLDRIDVIVPGERVVGIKRLSAGEWWASGAEVGASNRVFPFTLVLEALAQTTGGLLTGLKDVAEGAIGYFMSADHVRFRRPAHVGDELRLAVSLTQWKRSICKTHGVATVDGDTVITADLTTAVRATG